jgi:hypothetical protein
VNANVCSGYVLTEEAQRTVEEAKALAFACEG